MEKQTILVVDDTPENIDILVGILKKDYKVKAAPNGEKAINAVKKSPPDLILMDIMMPVMDGYEACKILKEDPELKEIPIIFLTAKTDTEDVVKGFEYGAVDYIAKPFNHAELIARVNTHLTIVKQKIQLAETDKIKAMTKVFEKFVPKQFLSRIAKQGLENIELGMAEGDVITILFSDIRSFTTLSERMDPKALLDYLNTYFYYMNGPIHDNDGFIDKFIGDAIMGLFDNPTADDHVEARCAIQASIDMQKALQKFNEMQAEQGNPPIYNGVGIHSGFSIIGTVGSEERMDSTVLGDTVNVASRLEGLTKIFGVKIIISGDTMDLMRDDGSDFNYRQLDYVKVKGKTEPTKIYEVYDCDPPDVQELKAKTAPIILEGLKFRGEQDWTMALFEFRKALDINPDDKTVQHHIDYIHYLQENPPSFDWDGVVDLSSEFLQRNWQLSKKISWSDDLLVGNEIIDKQHKELVDHLNSLIEALSEEELDQDIEQILDFLESYAEEHFKTEEEIMAAMNYPKYKLHKAAHQKFTKGLKRLRSEYDFLGNNLDLAYRIQSRLVNWLVEHITKEDRKITQN